MSVALLRRQMHADRERIADLAVAWHESSHYTVARALGYKPDGCSIDSPGAGSTRFRYPTRDLETSEGRRRLLAVYLAGGVGESLRFGREILGESGRDRRYVAELLALERDEPARLRAQSSAMDHAGRLLRAEWEFVTVLAAELRENRQWGVAA